ncbi:MAG: hypothetical protein LBU76_00465 [Azoarcus sp.]|jgi:hypothetical protein|nr:hypothetical protein [Azoarcus sp.]
MEYPATRGRKPVETEIIDTPKIDEDETNALIAAAEWDRNARALATQIGYALPADSTNPDLICRDIAANMRRSVDAVLDIGRGLLVLKTICGHGNFVNRIADIGIDRTLAKRFMQAAMKFSKGASTHLLIPKIESQTKLFELPVLDDVACMGVRELRRAVRELRGKVDAKDKVAQNNQKTINDLQERLVAREEAAPEDEEGDTGQAVSRNLRQG